MIRFLPLIQQSCVLVIPIKPKVLVSKVKALLRRFKEEDVADTLSIGSLIINRDEYKITSKGKEIILPKKEPLINKYANLRFFK